MRSRFRAALLHVPAENAGHAAEAWDTAQSSWTVPPTSFLLRQGRRVGVHGCGSCVTGNDVTWYVTWLLFANTSATTAAVSDDLGFDVKILLTAHNISSTVGVLYLFLNTQFW